jgi:hypothetical protein
MLVPPFLFDSIHSFKQAGEFGRIQSKFLE